MDDRKPRRAVSHRDFAFPRGKTEPGASPAGVPVEVDPESTPPPTDLAELTDALWPLRHTHQQIAAHGAAINGYTKQVERHEAEIKQWSDVAKQCVADIQHASRQLAELGAHLDAFFERDWKRITGSLDSVSEALQDLGSRMSKLEVSVANIATMQSSQAALVGAIDRRVAELERGQRDGVIASAERTRIFTFLRVVIVAAAGAVGWIANHFLG